MENRWFSILIFMVLLLFGCQRNGDVTQSHPRGFSDSDSPSDSEPWGGLDADDPDKPFPGCTSGFQFSFVLSDFARNVPYPSPIFTIPDSSNPTGLRLLLLEHVTTYLDPVLHSMPFVKKALNHLDGFGVSTPVWFQSNRAPNGSYFPDPENPGPGDTIFCVVLADEDHPHYGEYWPVSATWDKSQDLVRVAPYLPFAQETTYGCFITDRMKTSQNECYEDSDHLSYVLSDQPDVFHDQYYLLEPVRQKFAPYVEMAKEQYGLSPGNMLAATFFTTQSITHDLRTIHDELEDIAESFPPGIDDWELVETPGGNIDSVWETTYETIGWRHDGVFERNEEGMPLFSEPEAIPMRLNLPTKGIGGYDQPYPVIIYGHGGNSDLDESTEISRYLNEMGFAVCGINWVWHHARAQGAGDVLSTLRFFNFLAPLKMRDNFRQGVADIMWLRHVIDSLGELDLLPYETGGDGIPDLDVSHVLYFGQSLGGIHGGIVAAMEPNLDGVLLYVPASDFLTMALTTGEGQTVMQILDLLESQTGLDIKNGLLVGLDLMMAALDAGDPYAYGPYVIDEPVYDRERINLLEQMAAYDDTIGGQGSAQTARSIGLTLLEPYSWQIDGVNVGLPPYTEPAVFMYDTDDHGLFYQDNEIGLAAHAQAHAFLRAAYETGETLIIDGFVD